MIYTRIKDKRLYPNTVVFQTTDGKGVTYYNANVLEQIRAEIEQNAYPIIHGVNNHEKGMTLYGILQIIDKYKGDYND